MGHGVYPRYRIICAERVQAGMNWFSLGIDLGIGGELVEGYPQRLCVPKI
jgi:hypothetical protein